MFIRTQNLVATKALQDLILAGLIDATPAPSFDITAKVKLYQAGTVPNYNSVVADFTECNFTGYAAVVLASVVGPINLPSGEGMHKEVDFLVGTPVTSSPQSALGYYITDTGGTTLLAAEQFSSPVPMTVTGDAVSLDVILAPKIIWGGEQGA